jgi:ESS family glutamate:Na+ symporter
MGLEFVKNVWVLKLDMVGTTALAALLLMLGYQLRKKVSFFERFCIPAPVIGGFAFSLLALFCKQMGLINFKLYNHPAIPLYDRFLYHGRNRRQSGLDEKRRQRADHLSGFLLVCCGFPKCVRLNIGRLAGHTPRSWRHGRGGFVGRRHGAAAAFGPTAEQLGVKGATAVAIASATYGLIAGGLIGGPIAKWLIGKYNVAIKTAEGSFESFNSAIGMDKDSDGVTSRNLLTMMTLVLVIMTLGAWGSAKLKAFTGFDLPGYVGAMFVAIVFRNINDSAPFIKINLKAVDVIADVSIGIFLTMAMMTLRIWELYDLALPLIVILVLQTIALALFAIFVLFRALGKDYDAVVIVSGLMGHGLGATPNAVANMGAVCERYGVMSHKAFLIVP